MRGLLAPATSPSGVLWLWIVALLALSSVTVMAQTNGPTVVPDSGSFAENCSQDTPPMDLNTKVIFQSETEVIYSCDPNYAVDTSSETTLTCAGSMWNTPTFNCSEYCLIGEPCFNQEWPQVTEVGCFETTSLAIFDSLTSDNSVYGATGGVHPGSCAYSCAQENMPFSGVTGGTMCYCFASRDQMTGASNATGCDSCRGFTSFSPSVTCGSSASDDYITTYQITNGPPVGAKITSAEDTFVRNNGETVELLCETSTEVSSAAWYFNGSIVPVGNRYVVGNLSTNSITLRFTASSATQGNYTCVMSNVKYVPAGNYMSLSSNVTVMAGVSVTDWPAVTSYGCILSTPEISDLPLHSNYSGLQTAHPGQCAFTCARNGTVFALISGTKCTCIDALPSTVLLGAGQTCGEPCTGYSADPIRGYACGNGSVFAAYSIRNGPPLDAMITVPSGYLLRNAGENVSLTCSIANYSVATSVEWTLDGVAISTPSVDVFDNSTSSTLTVTASSMTMGKYTCTFSNDNFTPQGDYVELSNSAVANVTLSVQEYPSARYEECVPVASAAANLSTVMGVYDSTMTQIPGKCAYECARQRQPYAWLSPSTCQCSETPPAPTPAPTMMTAATTATMSTAGTCGDICNGYAGRTTPYNCGSSSQYAVYQIANTPPLSVSILPSTAIIAVKGNAVEVSCSANAGSRVTAIDILKGGTILATSMRTRVNLTLSPVDSINAGPYICIARNDNFNPTGNYSDLPNNVNATFTLTVQVPPTATISANPNTIRPTQYSNIILTCSASGGGTASTYTYSWSGPGITASIATPSLSLTNLSYTGVAAMYTCTVTDDTIVDKTQQNATATYTFTVQDVNECTLSSADGNVHNCNDNATCTNTAGAHTCACNAGYTGTGVDADGCTTVCFENGCLNSGSCAAPDVCFCHNRYSGKTCENLYPAVTQERCASGPATALTAEMNFPLVGSPTVDPGYCAYLCYGENMTYSAINYDTQANCYCGNTLDFAGAATTDTMCGNKCEGYETRTENYYCGAVMKYAVYSLNPLPPLQVMVTATSPTANSMGRFVDGSIVTLTCNTAAPDAAFTYAWERNSVSVPGTANTYVLTISNINDGIYTCNVTNPTVVSAGNYTLLNSRSGQVSLTHQTPPTVSITISTSTYVTGQTATFTCIAAGDTPVTFNWYQGTTMVNFNSRITTMAGGNESKLTISNLVKGDAGNYSCTATNNLIVVSSLQTSKAQHTAIVVQVPPTATISAAPSTITPAQYSDITLTCNVAGDMPPTLTYSWSSALTLPAVTNTPTLSLMNLAYTGADAAYTCTVTNGLIVDATKRVATATYTIRVQDVNECMLPSTDPNVHTCNDNATCTNTNGAHTCACNAGYTGTGVGATGCTTVCFDNGCLNSGSCVAPDVCFCHNRYSGKICENLYPAVTSEGCASGASSALTAEMNFPLVGSPTVDPGYCAYLCYGKNMIYSAINNDAKTNCYCGSTMGFAGMVTPTTCGGKCNGYGTRTEEYYCGTATDYAVYSLNPLPPLQVMVTATSPTANSLGTFVDGSSVTLTCNTDATDAAFTYAWQRNSVSVTGSANTYVFTIGNTNDGTYTCTVTNPNVVSAGNYTLLNSRSGQVTVTHQTPPVATIMANASTQVIGEKATFTCSATGDMPYVFRWYKEAAEITGDTRITISSSTTTSILTITNLVKGDGATYGCDVTNMGIVDATQRTSSISTSIFMVQDPPSATIDSTYTVVQGKPLTVMCTATGDATITYTWKDKNDAVISANTDYAIMPGGVLTINSANYGRDHGTLTCEASNNNIVTVDRRTSTVTTSINVLVPVTISNGPLVYVEEHQFGRSILSMVIASPVNPDPPAQNITWQHPDKQILTNSSSHFFLNNRRTLVVANSQPSDDGLYIATVDNGVGTATIQFNLTVYIAPDTTLIPDNLLPYSINMSDTLNITCTSTGSPKPRITWGYDGGALPSTAMVTQSDGPKNGTSETIISQLILPNIQYNERGKYNCTGTFTRLNRTSSSPEILDVQVQVQPTISLSGSKTQQKLEADSVSFSFTIMQPVFPTPTIEWYKPNSQMPLTNGAKYAISTMSPNTLTISNLDRNDVGMYTVQVRNDAGSATLTYNLQVYVKPLIIRPADGSTITVNKTMTIQSVCTATGFDTPVLTWTDQSSQMFTLSSSTGSGTTISGNTTDIDASNGPLKSVVLTITRTNAAHADGGTYVCKAEVTALGSTYAASSTVTVVVQVKPTLTTTLTSPIQKLEGEDVALQFMVMAPDFPTVMGTDVTWTGPTNAILASSAKYVFDQNRRNVTVKTLTRSDAGMYTATAVNAAGSGNIALSVQVNVIPIISTPANGAVLTVNESSALSIVCTSTAFPAPTSTWMFDTSPLPAGAVSMASTPPYDMATLLHVNHNTLTIANAQYSNRGTYICRSEIDVTPIGIRFSTASVSVIVQVKPTLQVATQSFTQLENSQVVLAFTIQSPVVPDVVGNDITWEGPMGVLPSSSTSKYTFSANRRSVTILTLGRPDAGTYTVTASNAAGSNSATFSVVVNVIPIISTPADGAVLTVNESSALAIVCTSTAFPAPTSTWMFDTSPLPAGAVSMASTPVYDMATLLHVDHNTLTIASAQYSNSGTYICRSEITVTTIGTRFSTASVSVIVQVKPTLQVATSNFTRLENSQVVLAFTIQSPVFPDVVGNDIAWKGPRGELPSSSTSKYTFSANRRSVTILTLGRLDAGEYNVTASNAAGSHSATFLVEVNVKPIITAPLSAAPTYTINEGQTLRVPCISSSYPQATVMWQDNANVVVGNSGNVTASSSSTYDSGSLLNNNTNTLTITNAAYGHRGNYICTSTITVPSGTHSAIVTITVDVQVGPKFQNITSGYLNVFEGAPFQIECATFAHPKPTFTWAVAPAFLSSTVPVPTQSDKMPYYTSYYTVSSAPVQNADYIYSITCTASNVISSPKSVTQVTVNVRPAYIRSTTGVIVVSNQNQANVQLNCEYRGIQQPTITWTRLSPNTVTGSNVQAATSTPHVFSNTLTFTTVAKNDEGNYTCTGTNSNGTASHDLYLRVQVLPQISPRTRTQNGVENKPLSLEVVVGYIGDPAVPTSNITWAKTNNASWSSRAASLLSADRLTLTISRIHHSDAGDYTACLINAAGSVCTTFTILYEEPPQIVIAPVLVRVNENARAIFSCSVSGNPAPVVTWSYNGTMLAGSLSTPEPFTNAAITARGSLGTKSTLTLPAVTNQNNQGMYTCTANNIHAPDAIASADLKIFVPTIQLTSTQAVSSSEGATARFICDMYGVPTPTISWFKDTTPISSGGDVQFSAGNVALVISNLKFSDRGMYQCDADNRDTDISLGGELRGTNVNLDVYIAPRITTGPISVTLNEDASTTRTCVTYGHPTPAVSWEHDNVALPASQVVTRSTTPATSSSPAILTSTLTISTVKFPSRGTYTCVSTVSKAGYVNGSSLAGTATDSAIITVNIRPRNVVISPPANVIFPGAITVLCRFSGNPAPAIVITAPGLTPAEVLSSITTSVGADAGTRLPYRETTLTIPVSKRNNNGTYSCQANTPAGQLVSTTDVTVLEKPDAPAQLTLFSNTPNFIEVEWVEPTINNAPITIYEIEFSYDNCLRQTITNVTQIPADNRKATIGVEPSQNYAVRIRATNNIGTGDYSTPLSVKTVEYNPEAPPQNVAVQKLTSDSAIISWSPIPCTEQNGIITAYEVEYNLTMVHGTDHRLQNTNGTVPVLSGTTYMSTISGLDAYTTYNFRVRGATAHGFGPYSDFVTNRTLTDIPLAPQNVVVDTASSISLNVSWTEPIDFNGVPTGYIVYYNASGTDANTEYNGLELQSENSNIFYGNVTLPANNFSIVLNNLLNFTNYTVYVEALTSAGAGDHSSELTTATDENVPGAPINVELSMNLQNEVRATWNPPPNPYGILTGYRLELAGDSRHTAATSTENVSVDFDVNQYNFTDVAAGFDYTVTVLAATIKGYGAPSADTFGRTVAGPPKPVVPMNISTNVSLLPVLASSAASFATLTWPIKKMSDEFGKIFTYQVFVIHLGRSNEDVLPGASPQELYKLGSDNVRNYTNVSQEVNAASPPTAYIAMEFSPDAFSNAVEGTLLVEIGNNSETENMFSTFRNIPLLPEHRYTIFLRGFSTATSRRRRDVGQQERMIYGLYSSSNYGVVQTTREAPESSSNAGAIAGAVIGVLLALCMAVVVALYWRRTQSKTLLSDEEPGGVWTAEREQAETSLAAKRRRSTIRLQRVSTQRLQDQTESRGALDVSSFAEHVAEMRANDSFLFAKEYEIITKQSPKLAYEVCAKPENKSKNRYANIVAYDETRVKLPLREDDPNSDYINANFLDGYNRPREYIACQGPVPESFADFWRMVWENNVRAVAMLTNLEEKGRLKCHQYWPPSGSVVYGPLTVTLMDTMTLADFIVRTFEIVKKGCSDEEVKANKHRREVKQFHFTVWPDHGVPDHATPLLNFLRRMRTYHSRDSKPQHPIIIHCSAGVGRTGTLMVIDAMLSRVAEEGNIDVFNYVMQLRSQRNFMVQTEAQYVFLHDALLEALNCGHTEVNAMNLRQYISALETTADGDSATNLELQFKKLSAGMMSTLQFRAAGAVVNKKKNRLANTLPYDNHRVRLTQLPGVEGSDYINGSYVDGFSSARCYIATQGPLQETLNDFWTMVWEQEVTSIVMLSKLRENNTEHSAEYWPKQDKQPLTFGKYLVKLETEHVAADIVLRTFSVTNTVESQSRTVHHFQYMGWPERGVPESGAGILDLIGQVQRRQMNSGNKPVVVHCSNGVGRTGIFCAVCTVIERVKLDSMIDVFQTIKLMRMQRVSMVQNAEQYLFVYRTIQEYLDSFDTYSNFK
ncbi:mucin-3B-like isoform X2 [Sycon ciliatum]|uniref:mucin-3B-like isoform X2 n=1 Tax=Sycon ciliatum TaxID=27933 RepID=UPI0031F64D83